MENLSLNGQSLFNNLTDELLIEIFIRLRSSDDAIRCKSLCKRWLSLISSNYFRSRHQKTLLPFTFLSHHQKYFREYESKVFNVIEFLPEKGLARRIDLGFLYSGRPDNYRISLEESFDDLILCSGNARTSSIDYYIINVFTKQWIVIPHTPRERSVLQQVKVLVF